MSIARTGVSGLGRPRPRSAVAAALLLAASVLMFGQADGMSDRPTAAVLWSSLALASYAGALLCVVETRSIADRGLRSWKLGPWSLLWTGVAFGIATLSWSQTQTGTSAEIAISNVLRALWLVAIGITAWTAGYLVGPGPLLKRGGAGAVSSLGRRFAAEVRSPLAPLMLYAVGFGARLAITATTGRFGYVGDAASAVSTAKGYGQVLNLLSLCTPLAICAAALQVFREHRPGARITLVVLFSTEVAFGAASGGKQNFVIAVLAVVIPMSVMRQKMPKILIMIGVVVFLIIVIPFNQAYRSVARNGSATLTASEAVRDAPEIFGETLTTETSIAVIPDSITYLLQRVREIDSPAVVMQRTPVQVAFLSPAQLVEAPLADLIPRAIWHGKPILTTGYEFGQEYYNLPSNIYGSAAITPVADLYRHGGWIPVIAGMFLLGCGVCLLDSIIDVRANPHAMFLTLLLFPDLVKSENDWITLMASIPGMILIWLLAVSLTFRRRLSQ